MIRPAATLILLRDTPHAPKVLMGQRGRGAVFMPDKFVFPGGAVDDSDAHAPCPPVGDLCRARLQVQSDDAPPHALLAAAARELNEETGLTTNAACSPLIYAFRALTPPGRSRRYDARFFMMDAGELYCDLDDFSNADGELAHLSWVPLEETKALNLAFITQMVLAELRGMQTIAPPPSVLYFENTEKRSTVHRIR